MEEMEEFVFDYGWEKWVTARDMLEFEKVRGHAYEDIWIGSPVIIKDENGKDSYLRDEEGLIVREITRENTFEMIWILKRTQDKTWTWEQTLDLPATVIYEIWTKRAEELTKKLEEDAKKSPKPRRSKRTGNKSQES